MLRLQFGLPFIGPDRLMDLAVFFTSGSNLDRIIVNGSTKRPGDAFRTERLTLC